jgi:hypothetical protein
MMNDVTTFYCFQYVTQLCAPAHALPSESVPSVGTAAGIGTVLQAVASRPASAPEGRWSHLTVAVLRI